MYRRELLRGAAALPLLALPALLSPEAAAQEAAPKAPRTGPAPRPRAHLARVRPGDPGWPSEASWQKLNAVGGNLIAVHSLFAGCEKQPDTAACVEVTANSVLPRADFTEWKEWVAVTELAPMSGNMNKQWDDSSRNSTSYCVNEPTLTRR